MSFREFFKSVAASYFIIVTLIVFAMYLLGMLFCPDETITYEAFLSPLLYGVFGVLPSFVMYSKKELTVRQFIVRKVLQLVCIEVLLVSFGFGVKIMSTDNISLLLSYVLSVLIIFVLANVIMFLLDANQARQLNTDLEEFQKRHSAENEEETQK